MLLPKLLEEVGVLKDITKAVRRKVNALKRLREREGAGWVPTEPQEWGRVRSINVPRGFFGAVKTEGGNYIFSNGVLLEMPYVDGSLPSLELPVSDVTIVDTPSRLSLGTEEFLASFSEVIKTSREAALEELLRRRARRGR